MESKQSSLWIFIHDSKEISGLHNIQCRNMFNAAIRHGEYWYGIAQRNQHLLSYWSLSLSLFHLYIPCLQCLKQHAVMKDCTNLSVPPPQHENIHRHTILMKVNMWCCWNATTVMLHTTKSEYTETIQTTWLQKTASEMWCLAVLSEYYKIYYEVRF